MRYRVLGTTQALRPDGTSVPVGGARLRALRPVRPVRADRVPVGLGAAGAAPREPRDRR
ncbi:hypothetical protein ACFY0F_03255 [Streptomyces sp. NPDC001544]|uniref:hypothetical protein n=1 Tax=Streptomyces sp. NPDC001544 TaxID=3364584 RepID=UPI00369C7BB6